MSIKQFGQIAMILALGLYGIPLNSQTTSQKATPEELLTLPPDCQRAMKDGGWGGHYCQGVLFLTRANSTLDKKARRYYLGVARGEFHYVVGHSPPGSPQAQQAQRYKDLVETLLNMP